MIKCQNMSEANLIVAVQQERFGFIDEWGVLIWTAVIILTILTGGFWILFIAGYHFNDIVTPKYYCNQCNAIVHPKQFRL